MLTVHEIMFAKWTSTYASKRLWDYKHTGFAMLKKQGTAPQDSLTGQSVNEGSKH